MKKIIIFFLISSLTLLLVGCEATIETNNSTGETTITSTPDITGAGAAMGEKINETQEKAGDLLNSTP